MRTPYLSVVIPVFNEVENLPELYARLVAVLGSSLETNYEILFVDDGSTDGSFGLLRDLHAKDEKVRVLRLSRNFGQHIAITAGIDETRGEVMVLMDADLQDAPEAIPLLLETLDSGFDVVFGVRQRRADSLIKRATSWLFVGLLNHILSERFSIDTHVFRAARRPVIDAVRECREHARFVIGLMSWAGFRQTGVHVPHAARFAGETKYSLFKMVALACNAITAFSRAPLQIASWFGIACSLASFALGVYLVLQQLVWHSAVAGWTSLLVAVLFLSGVQLLSLGILGEYVGRIYVESQDRPLYVIASRLEGGDDD